MFSCTPIRTTTVCASTSNDIAQLLSSASADRHEQDAMILQWMTHESILTIDDAIARSEREIDLLREYRTRLIADVVTGKLDVREAAARLPDEVEEPEPLDETEADADVEQTRLTISTPSRGGRGMTTDTSERGLERLICTALTGSRVLIPARAASAERGRRRAYGGIGWIAGTPEDYDREYCVDLAQLSPFCTRRSRKSPRQLDSSQDGPTRRKFLARLQGEITKRGTIDVLRHGIKHGPHHLDLFYGTPSPGNAKAAGALRRQPLQRHAPAPLQPRRDAARARPGLFINGLPIATFELKNSLTKQTVEDADPAVQARPRPAREALRVRPLRRALRRGRHEVRFCTHLRARARGSCPSTGLERRRGQSAQPERAQDRLPVEAHPHAARA